MQSNKIVFGVSSTLGRPKRIVDSPSPPSTDEKSPRSNKPNQSPVAASLDRKYLRFLRVAPEKQPVPTPQFRSYRKPSPSSSPTTLTSPITVSSSISEVMDVSKPPPRPPSETKPLSPFKHQPSPSRKKEPVNYNSASFDFPCSSQTSLQHSFEHTTNRSEVINSFRKCTSTSTLSTSQHQQCSPVPTSTFPTEPIRAILEPNNLDLKGQETHQHQVASNVALPRRSIIRRHSVEIGETKKQLPKSPSSKPQLAPKPTGYRLVGRNGSGAVSSSPALDVAHRQTPLYGSLNRGSGTGVGDVDIDANEAGYAKIKPRTPSNTNIQQG